MSEYASDGKADWAKHPDIEKMRHMTDGQIKDFLFIENDRLRAALAQAEKDHTELTGAYENASVEAERLRADNANLHEQLDTVSEAHNVMAKEGDRLRADRAGLANELHHREQEIDRLRAENAELRHLFDILLNDQTAWYRKARELLARTAKEGE